MTCTDDAPTLPVEAERLAAEDIIRDHRRRRHCNMCDPDDGCRILTWAMNVTNGGGDA